MPVELSTAAIAKIGQWIVSGDTGVSSETMVAIAMGAKRLPKHRVDAPHDASDFGRCYRLVKEVPEMRDYFDVIGRRVKAFKNILKNWDELCSLYERDTKTVKSTDLYQRINDLRGDRNSHSALKAA